MVTSMNTLFRFSLLAMLLGLAGCVPLREIAKMQGPNRPDILLYDRSMLAGFDLNRETIDAHSSYIQSPSGKRYTLEVKPHQFDIDQQRDYVSALLYPIAPDGSPLQRWRNGIWSFHFVVETNGVTQIIDQKWKFYQWLYCPLIHGAPN
jgi:hypothetical protein